MNALTITAIDNEPRVHDLVLAERLGFSEPRMIRKLISRHLPYLEQLGVCATVEQTVGPKGGRPGTAYFLNEDQALYVCVSSDTPKANDIKVEVVRSFGEYRRSQLPAIPTNFVEALRLAADEAEKRMIADQKLQVAQEVIEEQLNHVTVDEWRALNHLYLGHGVRVKRSADPQVFCGSPLTPGVSAGASIYPLLVAISVAPPWQMLVPTRLSSAAKRA